MANTRPVLKFLLYLNRVYPFVYFTLEVVFQLGKYQYKPIEIFFCYGGAVPDIDSGL